MMLTEVAGEVMLPKFMSMIITTVSQVEMLPISERWVH